MSRRGVIIFAGLMVLVLLTGTAYRRATAPARSLTQCKLNLKSIGLALNGRFELLPAGDDGILRSTVLPGLWLDPAAVVRGDLARALEVLNQGLAHPTHQ